MLYNRQKVKKYVNNRQKQMWITLWKTQFKMLQKQNILILVYFWEPIFVL